MKKLLKQYQEGKIGKREFADQMMSFHKILLQYAEFINEAENLQSINLLPGGGGFRDR